MQLSASDAPFQFNFGAVSDNVAPSLKAFGVEEQKASRLSSVEVRPPASVSCGTFPSLALLFPQQSRNYVLQLAPSLELDQIQLTDALYLLKVAVQSPAGSRFCFLPIATKRITSHTKASARAGSCQQCCSSLLGAR